ncbi:MAG: acyltransferase family protein [Acidimicrobiia bacterium]
MVDPAVGFAIGSGVVSGGAGTEVAPRSGRRLDIQGLRGIAVLMVVAFHADLPVSGGFAGVDVFFVISGFVITSMLASEIARSGRVSFAAFYARRVRRILPALAMVVTVVAIASLGGISPAEQPAAARTGVAASFSVANLYLYGSPAGYFDPSQVLNPLLHTWSLSVEEQFYLFFPAFLVAGFWVAARMRRDRDPRPLVAGFVGVLAVVSFLACVYATFSSFALSGPVTHDRLAFYLAPTRAWEFALGCLLALAVAQLRRIPPALGAVIGLAGAGLVVYASFAFDETTAFPGAAAAIPVLGAALLIVAGTASARGLPDLLAIRPLTWMGDISYSWYLWHWPFIVIGVALFPFEGRVPLIAAVLSIIPSWLAYRWVESPLRANQRFRGRRALALAGVCVIVPTLACLVLLKAPKPSQTAATRALLRASRDRHADRTRGCNKGRAPSAQPPTCTWSVPASRGDIVLLGDSNAGHFVEPIARAANALGYSVTAATSPACPSVGVELITAQRPDAQCRRFTRVALADVLAHRPAAVVLSTSTTLYLTSTGVDLRDPATGETGTTPDAKSAIWTRGLHRTLEQLTGAGIPVLVVHPVPQWTTWGLDGCAAVRVYYSPRSCGTDQTIAEARRFHARATRIERAATRGVDDVAVLDLTAELCPHDRCVTNRADTWIYRDGRHLTVPASLTLTPQFQRALAALLTHGVQSVPSTPGA